MSLLARLQARWRSCRGIIASHRFCGLGVVLVVGLLLGLGTAGALSTATAPAIPQPEPGVNKSYNGTFRILASNDKDPYYNTSTIQVPKYHPNGSVTVRNKTVGSLPFRLQGGKSQGNLWPTQTLETAVMTDGYVTRLQGLPPIVPYRDEWTSLAQVRGRVEDIRFIRLNTVTHGDATSTGGAFRVLAQFRRGVWLPVYRANVTETEDGYAVANPDEALVLTPKGQMAIGRQLDGLDALLRYSALADTEQEAQEKAAIPMDSGEELYPTSAGDPAPLVWRNSSATVVKDAYIGILNVVPGVWYRDGYVTKTPQVTGYVPWDYRSEPPADYAESGTCTVGTANSSTTTHSKRKWATYRVLTTDERINVTIRNDTYTQRMSRLGRRAGVWSTYRNEEMHPLSPGNYTLTANLTITTTLNRHYGVTSKTCETWEKTDTVTVTTSRRYSVPVRTIDPGSPGLSINTTVYDRPRNDVVVLNWSGDQRLTRHPWRQVTVSIGNKSLSVDGPWHFYPVVQNTAVEERSDEGTTNYTASHSYGGRYPGLLRKRVGMANVTVRLSDVAQRRSWWRETHTAVATTIPATSLPETIIAPDNDGPTPLYTQYGGIYFGTGERMGESVSVTAESVFGYSIANTSVTVVPYHTTNLSMWLETQNGTTRVAMRLTAAETGTPLANRTLQLRGMNRSNVTTSARGMAYAKPTKTLVSARFQGDPWQTDRASYYTKAHAGLVTGFGFLTTANTLFGYLDVAISNVVELAEWLAIGILAYWWVRIRSPYST